MKCPNCNHENPDSNNFCAECGTKLEVNPSVIECPNCHNQVPADSKFCPDCGNQLRIDSNNCSTLDEFKSGNIKVYGVTLGLTNRLEFQTNSEFDEHSSLGFYRKNNPRVDYRASRRENPTSDKDFFNQPLNMMNI